MSQETVVKERRWIAVQCAYCRRKGVVTIKEPMQPCPTCLGRGRAAGEYDLPCAACLGKGVVSA